MDDPITARYVWDVEAMTEALAAHRNHSIRPVFRHLLVLLILFYVFLSIGIPIWMIVDSRSLPEARRNATIALVVALVAWGWLISGARSNRFLRWRARKVFRSKPGGSEFVEWSIGPDQLTNRTNNSASTILWPLFMKVVETPKGFVLYQSIQFFNWIPAHAFASDEAVRRFAELARAKVPQYVVVGECQYVGKPEPIANDEL
jgi:YcxB-like protein